jgi:hypothetical protein
MKSTLGRIGNSRGVIEPVTVPRAGWFNGYLPEVDEDVWKDLVETESEFEDWQWEAALDR